MTAPQPWLSQIDAPTRSELDALPGLTLLAFGTGRCGHQAGAPGPAFGCVLQGSFRLFL